MPVEGPNDVRTYSIMAEYSGDSSPSLEPAVLRVQRAVHRLNDVRDTIDKFEARALRHPMQVGFHKRHVESGTLAEPRFSWKHDRTDFVLQQELRVLTGEVAYHLRTVLEYLAYHLVWHDRGSPFDRSQFPVVPEAKAAEWAKTAEHRLPGVTTANLERIRLLQPFAGCAWTAELTALGNIHKHRSPIKVGVSTGAQFSIDDVMVTPDPHDSEWYIVESAPTLDAQTHDGKPLHATLRSLCVAVNGTLETFSSVLPGPKPSGRVDQPAASNHSH